MTACAVAQDELGGDWFQLDVPAGDTVDATARFDHDEWDIDLLLYTIDGVLRRWSSSLGDEESVQWTTRTDTTIYLRARLWEDGGLERIGNSYELDVSVR